MAIRETPSSQTTYGAAVAELDDASLQTAVEATMIFAKLSPLDKGRIVRVLRAKGHVVGFMGDGINDAADIGMSVDTTVDIGKEAADIILLEKSLMVLSQGVIEDPKTFANMLKITRMTWAASCCASGR